MDGLTISRMGQGRWRRWLALPLSAALGGVLVGLLFLGLRPASVSAAPAADPAVAYACSQSGLNSALAAGGSATFTCASPTIVTVTSAPKVVNKNVSLDGGNKLILSGGGITGVFTVAAGIHLGLLNLTVRDAGLSMGAGVYNNGFLAVTHTYFISNAAALGAAVYNAPGAVASLSGSTFETNQGEGGAVWNGAEPPTRPATLTVSNSQFLGNFAGEGAAIFNQYGLVSISGSLFSGNNASIGGAIVNYATLHVSNSQFTFNGAGTVALDSQVQLLAQPAGLDVPAGSLPFGTGGAIYALPGASTLIAGSFFTQNLATSGGGAVSYGLQPGSPSADFPYQLTVSTSSFADNCSGGGGGALSAGLTSTVSDSSFSYNFADANSNNPCVSWAASRPGTRAPAAGQAPAGVLLNFGGSGGAILNSGRMSVDGTSFLFNTATYTSAGGGGAIDNYLGSQLVVGDSTFDENEATQSGGAIFNDLFGVARISGSRFTHNQALNDSGGGIATVGPLTVTDSSFVRNGGAPGTGVFQRQGGGAIFVYTSGPTTSQADLNGGGAAPGPALQLPQGPGAPASLYAEHDTFISNTSEYEGGAIDGGPLTVVDSTFLDNRAAWGGAINAWLYQTTISASTFIGNQVLTTTEWSTTANTQGGALDTNDSPVSILNSTFYQNRAQGFSTGGAINVDDGPLYLTNTTLLSNTADLAGYGGGVFADGFTSFHNVLLAFNGHENCNIPVTLSGANLEYPGVTCGGASVQANPLAQAPAGNGGPTLTSALLPASPAINVAAADSGCPSTDQRSAHRPFGAHCDLGAFEYGVVLPRQWLPLIRK